MENQIVKKLHPIIEEIVKSLNLNLYDLEFVKEDGIWFLRVSIEKDDQTMDFETAEVASDAISKKLDELDPIDHEYILDVCSPGAERPLRNKEEFLAHVNEYIHVELKEEMASNDSFTGDLLEVKENSIVMSYKDKTRTKKIEIDFSNINKANLAVKF